MSTTRSAWGKPFPANAWYAVADADEVTRAPLGRRALGVGIVLYRDTAGSVVALHDRCAHKPYPLSLGTVDGDNIISGYSGFGYAPDGALISVPTQSNVPIGGGVRAFPITEASGLVWVWMGNPGLAPLNPLTSVPWIYGEGWETFFGSAVINAHASLLQDNMSDITHVAYLDPTLAPTALTSIAPPLNVEVAERSVRFWRDYPPSPIQDWQRALTGTPAGADLTQREEGHFVGPGIWLDRWDIEVTGHGELDGTKTMHFSHAITPVDEHSTRHVWAVSRNFAFGANHTRELAPRLEQYYQLVHSAMEQMQQVLIAEGPQPEANVQADAALVAVRRIMKQLREDEA